MALSKSDHKTWAKSQPSLVPFDVMEAVEQHLANSKCALDLGADMTSLHTLAHGGCVVLPRRSGLKKRLIEHCGLRGLDASKISENPDPGWTRVPCCEDKKFDFVRLLSVDAPGKLLADVVSRLAPNATLVLHRSGNGFAAGDLLSGAGIDYRLDECGDVVVVYTSGEGGIATTPAATAAPEPTEVVQVTQSEVSEPVSTSQQPPEGEETGDDEEEVSVNDIVDGVAEESGDADDDDDEDGDDLDDLYDLDDDEEDDEDGKT